MSAAAQPNSFDSRAVRDADENVPESGLFSSVLHNATFVSSEGRVYRLFPEGEGVSLGRTFSLDAFRDRSFGATDGGSSNETIDVLTFPGTSASKPESVAMPAPLPAEKPSECPLEETIRRKRAVEGICGRRQTPMPIRIFQSLSEKVSAKTIPSTQTLPNTKKGHAGSPISRDISIRGHSLLKKESADDRESVFRCDTVPFLDGAPDFFARNSKKSSAASRKSSSSVPPSLENAKEIQDETFDLRVFSSLSVAENIRNADENLVRTSPIAEPETVSEVEPEQGSKIVEETLPERRTFVRIVRLDLPHVSRTRIARRPFEKTHRLSRLDGRAEQAIENEIITLEQAPEMEQPPLIEGVPEAFFPEEAPSEIPETAIRAAFSSENESSSPPLLHGGALHENALPIEWANWKPTWPEHVDSMRRRGAESIRLLSDHLATLHRRGIKVVSFNGFQPGDGCTTVILCAARQLAASGFRVLLADAHAENPELPRLLDIPSHPTFYEIVVLEERLEFLPWSASAIEVEQDGQVESREFGELVAMVRDEFDLVLVDNGSLVEQALSERERFWRQMGSDGVLLVVNTQNRNPVNLPVVAAKLRRHGVELLGITENYVRAHEPASHEPRESETVSPEPEP